MSNEASRKAFEVFMRDHYRVRTLTRDGDSYEWAFAGELWAGWQASRKALEAEQATECSSDEWLANCPQSVRDLANIIKQAQTVEPVAYLIDWPDEPELGHYFSESATESGRSTPLFTHPAPPPAEPTVKQPLSTERAELGARLLECLSGPAALTTREATAIKDAADMLEADLPKFDPLSYMASNKKCYDKGVSDGLKQAQQVEVPAGHVLVPLEPTGSMIHKACGAWLDCGSKLDLNKTLAALKAGIAAAPQPPQGDKT